MAPPHLSLRCSRAYSPSRLFLLMRYSWPMFLLRGSSGHAHCMHTFRLSLTLRAVSLLSRKNRKDLLVVSKPWSGGVLVPICAPFIRATQALVSTQLPSYTSAATLQRYLPISASDLVSSCLTTAQCNTFPALYPPRLPEGALQTHRIQTPLNRRWLDCLRNSSVPSTSNGLTTNKASKNNARRLKRSRKNTKRRREHVKPNGKKNKSS